MIQIMIFRYLLFFFLWSTFWICQNLRHFWLAYQARFTRLVGSGARKQRAVWATNSDIWDTWCTCLACTHIKVHSLIHYESRQQIWWYHLISVRSSLINRHFLGRVGFFHWWNPCTGKTSSSRSIGFTGGSCKVTLRLGTPQNGRRKPQRDVVGPLGLVIFCWEDVEKQELKVKSVIGLIPCETYSRSGNSSCKQNLCNSWTSYL